MSFRFSFASDPVDAEIDELMKMLYPEQDILEQKCINSITGKLIGENKPQVNIESDKTAEVVVESLPIEYFTPDFDPVEGHLFDISSWHDEDITERFMNKIENTDTDKDVIIGHLTEMIDENYDDLMACMQNIQSIDVDLCRAGIQVNHSRRKIKSVVEIVESGSIKITDLNRRKARQERMKETLQSIKALKDIHKAMTNSMNTGEVGKAAEYARNVLETLKNESFDQYACLKNIGEGMQRNINIIRQKADKALKRLCSRKFATTEYENIAKAYLILDYLAETQKINLHDSNYDDPSNYFDSFGCMEGLAQRINRFQLEDIDGCLHTAVMEYIYVGQQKKQQAAAALAMPGAYQPMLMNEMMMDITEIPLNMLYRRLTPDLLAPCVVRSCELLADIIHTHYLITQWHSSPFDPKNKEWLYLHRNPIDLKNFKSNYDEDDDDDIDDEEEEETTPEEDDVHVVEKNGHDKSNNNSNPFDDDYITPVSSPTKKEMKSTMKLKKKMNMTNTQMNQEVTSTILSKIERQLSHGSNSSNQHNTQDSPNDNPIERLIRLNGVKLAVAYQSLGQSRHILWEELLRALVDMLNMMTITSSVKPDDFLAMAWVLQSIIELGKEFCGIESKPLNLCLQEKSKEYFQYFHLESFQMIRQMIESESWISVPITLTTSEVANHIEGSESILSMIRNNISRDASAKIMKSGLGNLGRQSAANNASGGGVSNVGGSMGRRASLRPSIANLDLSAGTPQSENNNMSKRNSFKLSTGSLEEVLGGGGGNGATSTPGLTVGNVSELSSPVPTVGGGSHHQSNVPLSILQMFGKQGNPFHFMTDSNACNHNNNDNQTTSEDESPRDSNLTSQNDNTSNSNTNNNNNDSSSNGDKILRVDTKDLDQDPNRLSEEDLQDEFWRMMNGEFDAPAPLSSKRHADQSSVMVVTQTALNGLVKYTAKYLHMMYLLPAAAPDIFIGLCQLFDYYLCAVFNGFVPAEERNRFLAKPTKGTAPAPDQARDFEALQNYLERTLNEFVNTGIAINKQDNSNNNDKDGLDNSSLLNDSVHTGGTPNPASNTNASMKDIPIASFEAMKISNLLRLPSAIQFADHTTCYALNERIVAGESCYFVAKILSEIKTKLIRMLPDRYQLRCENYVDNFQLVAGQLRALIYKAVCPLLIKQSSIVSTIVDCTWDSRKLRDQNHDWVNTLVKYCNDVWAYMMLTDQFAESSSLVREQVWLEICQCAFDSVLEAYSKVKKVSAEGRAAMTMDVFAVHEGLNTIHLCRPPRGKHYIDNYLRVSFLSEDDMMAWVNENWQSYAYRHIQGMLVQTLASVMNSKKLKDATSVIDNLYELDNTTSSGNKEGAGSKLSNLLSSNLLTTKFRR